MPNLDATRPPATVPVDPSFVITALDKWRTTLLDARDGSGHWCGELSPSALSTATAVSALATVLREGQAAAAMAERLRSLVSQGIAYLVTQQNSDGGFGDTDRSYSNIATSYLALAAWRLAEQVQCVDGAESYVAGVEKYIESGGGLDGLRQRYGKDKTFVVPIMTNCAIAGMVDWKQVPRLPFEAAVFPQSMYRFLQMPVVSYAVPALVAIGQARHFLGPPALLPIRVMRGAAVDRTMGVLRAMQPDSGGYLEATPLTSFVLMSLAATHRGDCPVAQDCIRFLLDSVLPDGSWPIDTNLATWVTSLAMFALQAADEVLDPLAGDHSDAYSDDADSWCSDELLGWHLSCQHTQRHPFTGANPGGWGWSDLSGAVPDGDDTPGAILALAACRKRYPQAAARSADIETAFAAARRWLLQLQNRDGGWPTFCRGWGKLPFDRSSVDLTAHAIRALAASEAAAADREADDHPQTAQAQRAIDRGFAFLAKQQQPDGSWLPLWFGNQDIQDDLNPYYGTGRVLLAYADVAVSGSESRIAAACRFLLEHQNDDGGWGGGESLTGWLAERGLATRDASGQTIVSSIEETAVVTEALAAILLARRNFASSAGFQNQPGLRDPRPTALDIEGKIGASLREAVLKGAEFLRQAIESGRGGEAWPIGFYFAKLWYHESFYPAVFATAALSRVLKLLQSDDNAI